MHMSNEQFQELLQTMRAQQPAAASPNVGAMLISNGKALKLSGHPTEKVLQLDNWLEDCETRLRVSNAANKDWLAVACTWGGAAAKDLAKLAKVDLSGEGQETWIGGTNKMRSSILSGVNLGFAMH